MVAELPALCIDIIIKLLATQGLFRRECDVVCDCVRLCATSKGVRAYIAVPLASILSPPTSYELLPDDVQLPQLKALCCQHHLPVGGRRGALRKRLWVALHDPRLIHCCLGTKLCKRARTAFVHNPSSDVRKLLQTLCMNMTLMQSPFTFASVVTALLLPFNGDESRLIASRLVEDAKRRSGIGARRILLKVALRERNCSLRNDSLTSAAYINGGIIQGFPVSLEKAVDMAEEMQFLYTKTAYSTLLSEMRYFDRTGTNWNRLQELDIEGMYDRNEAKEECRRRSAKRDAVTRWTSENGPELVGLPRSLRFLVSI